MAVAVSRMSEVLPELRRVEAEARRRPPASTRTDRNFRRVLARHAAERRWVLTGMMALADVVVHLLRYERAQAFRGKPVGEEEAGVSREIVSEYIRVSEVIRERCEFYDRHKVPEPAVKAFLRGDRDRRAALQTALRDMLTQKPSLSPSHRSLAPAEGGGDAA